MSQTVEKTETKSEILTSGFNPLYPIYTMHFRRGNRKPEDINFQFNGNLYSAIQRSRNYCEKMGFRFCGVHSFLSDLDKDEKTQLDGTPTFNDTDIK